MQALNECPPPAVAGRRRLPFRLVNQRGKPGYDGALQRHHLLPLQIVGRRCFQSLFNSLGRDDLSFDDFRSNGLLLPASDRAAVRIGLPLHRGPHRDYNALVIERVGQIEAGWAARRRRCPDAARAEALERLRLLQRALRRRLLAQRRPLRLNRHDPLGRGLDFTELDAMVDLLWPATASSLAD